MLVYSQDIASFAITRSKKGVGLASGVSLFSADYGIYGYLLFSHTVEKHVHVIPVTVGKGRSQGAF